ncbi:hypothetical protein Mal64_14960 [Pseudobythopirellula maris]|uniref:Phage holin family protein n=1 Tax=Pseudobythopirellula maris TaxID=2527991 RepID=A0A5C5ZVQ9_9BACT|nr:phage holin family protein [Pseudobythopirellula maris]TWT91097.1 hypothetical protein Mal64_14960 [Pseudobythopirellula maris]
MIAPHPTEPEQRRAAGAARNGGPSTASTFKRAGASFGELALLQWRLLKLDLKRGARKLGQGAAFGAIGLAFVLGAFPVALFAEAQWLIAAFGLSPMAAHAIAAASGALVGLALAYAGYRKLHTGLRAASRSLDDLEKNLTSIGASRGEAPR